MTLPGRYHGTYAAPSKGKQIWVFDNEKAGGRDHIKPAWNCTRGTAVRNTCPTCNPDPGQDEGAIGGAGKSTRRPGCFHGR
ncbi:hypothetical protein [Streptomyces flavofungini]|uniref:hypothetical protein n=1 Tax=Streptomyces flavofungini TaxID=68200 RepID=UPI0025B0EDA1|nr:hypothetical protein [Streptomyces flavofungini]WJV44367.1 hypothetical protein QUY26_01755 [Streptomyces flavofungini]